MKEKIKSYFWLVIGSILMAVGVSLFLAPNKLSSGGFSGIAIILYYLFNLPIGTVIVILNIPLFIFAYFKIGKEFFIRSIIGTIILSLSINYLEGLNSITNDKFLGCIFGGIINGIGASLVLRVNGSTGGTEVLSALVRAFKPKFRTGNLISVFDIIIVAANVFVFKEIEIGLYSAITIYMSNKMIDLIFEGTNFTKMIYIISDKYSDIVEKINVDLPRGATGIYSKGMYTNKNKMMIMCVVSRNEVFKIRGIVKQVDSDAFIIISNAREVFGKGFKNEVL